MRYTKSSWLIIMLALALVLSACNFGQEAEPTPDVGAKREVAFVVPQDLRTADEVFLTSAVRGILAVTTVDGVRIGDGRAGPLTRRLLSLYQRLVNEAS